MTLEQTLLAAAILVAASTPTLARPHGAPTFNYAGRWASNWGDMSLRQNGSRLTGDYTHNDGKIVAVVKGRVAEGFWMQSSAARRCATSHDGSYSWGRLRFTTIGRSFQGVWGYCEDKASNGGGWTGQRR
jgi:hypothetical protein